MPKGVVTISDEKIRAEFASGKFKRQICREHKVGINRIRRVLRGIY